MHIMLTAESGFSLPLTRESPLPWLGHMVPAAAVALNGPPPAGKAKERGLTSRFGMLEAKGTGTLAKGPGSKTADGKAKAALVAKALSST